MTPADLEALTDEFGPLRWSSSTSKVGRGPLTITECSLTPTPASVELHPVSWYRDGVSRGNMPSQVRSDVKRGRDDLNRRRDTLDVFEADQRADGLPPLSAYTLADVRGGSDVWGQMYRTAQANGHRGVAWDGPNGVTYGIR